MALAQWCPRWDAPNARPVPPARLELSQLSLAVDMLLPLARCVAGDPMVSSPQIRTDASIAVLSSPLVRAPPPVLPQLEAPMFSPPTLTVFKPPLTVKIKVPPSANDAGVPEFTMAFSVGTTMRCGVGRGLW